MLRKRVDDTAPQKDIEHNSVPFETQTLVSSSGNRSPIERNTNSWSPVSSNKRTRDSRKDAPETQF